MHPPTPGSMGSRATNRSRVGALRLPADLPPRDLERLAAVSSSVASIPAPASAPASFGLPGVGGKFGCEGSPADVRVYAPAVAPLLMRGGVVSPGHGGGSGLVLPNLSLPHSGPGSTSLPPVSQPLSAPAPEPSHSPLTGVSHHSVQALPPPPNHSLHGTALARTHSQPLPHAHRSVMQPLPRSTVSNISLPQSPQNPPMTQNEIKKAQNRKSAKRFREAQKQRWKNMSDDLLVAKRTIAELQAQVSAQEAHVARANAVLEGSPSLPRVDPKRSAMSIHDLVDSEMPGTSPTTPPPVHSHVEAEAALYAQILSNTVPKATPDAPPQAYASEVGLLTVSYVVAAQTSRVVSLRRGSPTSFDTFAVDGLSEGDRVAFRKGLTCGKPVAVTYVRHGMRVNALMTPVEASDRVLVAEFAPMH